MGGEHEGYYKLSIEEGAQFKDGPIKRGWGEANLRQNVLPRYRRRYPNYEFGVTSDRKYLWCKRRAADDCDELDDLFGVIGAREQSLPLAPTPHSVWENRINKVMLWVLLNLPKLLLYITIAVIVVMIILCFVVGPLLDSIR